MKSGPATTRCSPSELPFPLVDPTNNLLKYVFGKEGSRRMDSLHSVNQNHVGKGDVAKGEVSS
jgi:hypothetical protein